MGRTGLYSPGHNGHDAPQLLPRRVRDVPVFLLIVSVAALASAEDLTVSAKVDKTSVESGDPIALTLTLGGDLSEIQVPPPEFPEGFTLAARSQSTNFSVRAGVAAHSTTLAYVLVPQQAGTFRLGPFTVRRRGKEFKTDPIEITVKKPAVPHSLQQPRGERFTL